MLNTLYFWVFATIAGMCGLGVILSRNPMHSAVSLVITMVCIAALFLQLHTEFLAYIQIIVYTGAVMVLIVFTISMLNLRAGPPLSLRLSRRWGIALAVIYLVFFAVYQYLDKSYGFGGPTRPEVPIEWGNVRMISYSLFTTYLFPFEFAGVLLTAAVIGAAVIARPEPQRPGEQEDAE